MEVTKSQELYQNKYPSVVDRYFKKKYYLYENRQKEAFCILVHSNRICIVTLGETHPILSQNKTIQSVCFTIGDVNRLDNKVSGKAKRGAQTLTASSPLCEITCDDGEKFIVPAGMKGQLVEVNTQLLNNPSLLTLKVLLHLLFNTAMTVMQFNLKKQQNVEGRLQKKTIYR